MPKKGLRPRCTIQIFNVLGEVVPILEEGASITPGTGRTPYRETWSEEEDLVHEHRQRLRAPDGTMSIVPWLTGVHGNIGYEMLLTESTRKFSLRVDYFTVLVYTANGRLEIAYEPKAVSVSGVLGRGGRMHVDVDLQAGFSDEAGRPDFQFLRVTWK